VTESFDADWLALREPFDGVARNTALVPMLGAALPARPRIMDLGAGTGSLFRWLAPRLGRAQAWTLVDADDALIAGAYARTADWAARHGWPVSYPGRAMLVHGPHGAWRLEGLIADLADAPDNLPLARHDAVVNTALCDLVSAGWLARMAATLRVPFYAALNVDGRDAWLPAHPLDRRVAAAFRRDQARDKGFGRALGPRAPAAMARIFRARGFGVALAPSDWRIGRSSPVMAAQLMMGHANVAGAAAEPWRRARSAQVSRGQLAVRIGHTDVLALPR
jgi:hypothetical protein